MGFRNPSSLLFVFHHYLTISGMYYPIISATDTSTLIYKGCANQKSEDLSGIFTQNLKSLLSSLISQSSQKTFFTTSYGDGQNAITGLYQCRGDLTAVECSNCVTNIPEMADKLCGKAIAARIHLSGCYLRYEIAGFKQVSATEFLYKVCGSTPTRASGSGFEEKRESAFEVVENGIKNNGGVFSTGSFESVYVLGQCEGNLGSEDCGDCLKSGFDRAKTECGDFIAGQIYLHRCYISYSYYPNGVPTISSPPGSGHKTQRTVAIAVGGVAGLGFLIVCLLFAKQVVKKRKGGKYGNY